MADQQAPPAGPDLSKGIALSEFAGETLLGHVGDDEVVLVRSGSEIFAIGAYCSHYHGPLAEGLVTGEGIRCPWHHACFNLRTGEATRAPALSPVGLCARATDRRPLAPVERPAARTVGNTTEREVGRLQAETDRVNKTTAVDRAVEQENRPAVGRTHTGVPANAPLLVARRRPFR